ncbi:MAG TPA: toll/interleukin-1 receptor domain-containing protein, partial [Myxococcaceae bacterium]|nr:toll/interleukin-1 receptor domain-containing protein [Myxococcaceae bacterium]
MIVLVHSAADVEWVKRLQGRLPASTQVVEVESALDTLRPLSSGARAVVLLMSPEMVVRGREMAELLLDVPDRSRVVSLSVRRCEHGSSALAVFRAVLNHWHPLLDQDDGEVERTLAAAVARIAALATRGRELSPPLARANGILPSVSPPGALPTLNGVEIEPAPRRREGFLRTETGTRGGVDYSFAAPRERVRLGASAPRLVKPGQEFTARFAAYHPALAKAIKRQLRKAGAGAAPHLNLWESSWRFGTTVTVHLSGDGLEVSPSRQQFVWMGHQHLLDFDVRAEDRAARYDTRLKLDVSIEGVVLVRLRLDLTVTQPRRRDAWSGRRRCVHAESPKRAFASYAAEDRARVLDRVSAVRIAAGVDVFMDCLSLRAAQYWAACLANEISQREVFMLFWSEHAAASRCVEWEWRHALKQKGLDAIQPHPLDPWPKAPLPEELSCLHMGDPLMAVRAVALRDGSRGRTSDRATAPLPSPA